MRIDKFKVFGTECFVYVPEENLIKSLQRVCGWISQRLQWISRICSKFKRCRYKYGVIFKPEKLSAGLIDVVYLNGNSNKKKENEVVVVENNLSISVNEDNETEENSHELLQPLSDNDLNKQQSHSISQTNNTDF